METRHIIGILCLLSGCSQAVSPSPTILLPTVHIEPQHDDTPIVIPSPSPVTTEVVSDLKFRQWYVVESSVELLSIQWPDGMLAIQSEKGPIQTRGEFADNPGVIQTRTFKQPYVYFFSAEKAGVVELVVFPVGVKTQSEFVRQTITVTDGTAPNPPPIDPVVPTPVDPITTGKLQILIVEDPALRASIDPEQIAIMDGLAVREYAKTHCSASDGTPDFRVLSVRQDLSSSPKWIQTAFAECGEPLPFLIASNGKSGHAGPLPKTINETLTLLKKYGGE